MVLLTTSWTEDRVAELTRLWATGLSATGIAAALGGCTRNAVLGKVHRMDLPERAFRSVDPDEHMRRAQARREADKSRKRSKRGSVRILAPRVDSIPPTPVTEAPAFLGSLEQPLSELRPLSKYMANQCRHMQASEPSPDYLCCANETELGASWCGFHAQIVWTVPALRQRVPASGARRGAKVSNFVGSYELA